MTPTQPHLAPRQTDVRTGPVRVCWSSFNGRAERRLVFSIDLESPGQAFVEACVEEQSQRRILLERQRMAVETSSHDRLRHIDVIGGNGDGRIAALTLLQDQHGERVIYAHTSLLSRAGFHAGTYDAPVLSSASLNGTRSEH